MNQSKIRFLKRLLVLVPITVPGTGTYLPVLVPGTLERMRFEFLLE
jgi:hypothetical protein